MRNYPNDLAAHVLGFVGRNGDTNSADYGQMLGCDGVASNVSMTSWRAPAGATEKDPGRGRVAALRDQDVPARDGFNVVLTVDSVIKIF